MEEIKIEVTSEERAWTPSAREEVFAALWLIAGFQAWQCGFKVSAITLFIKAVFDLCCAVKMAISEIKEEQEG